MKIYSFVFFLPNYSAIMRCMHLCALYVCAYRGFWTRMVYLNYITWLRYTILIRNPRIFIMYTTKMRNWLYTFVLSISRLLGLRSKTNLSHIKLFRAWQVTRIEIHHQQVEQNYLWRCWGDTRLKSYHIHSSSPPTTSAEVWVWIRGLNVPALEWGSSWAGCQGFSPGAPVSSLLTLFCGFSQTIVLK